MKGSYVGRSTLQYPSQSFKLWGSQWGASLPLQRASGGSYLHQGDQILGQIGAGFEQGGLFLPYRVKKKDGTLMYQKRIHPAVRAYACVKAQWYCSAASAASAKIEMFPAVSPWMWIFGTVIVHVSNYYIMFCYYYICLISNCQKVNWIPFLILIYSIPQSVCRSERDGGVLWGQRRIADVRQLPTDPSLTLRLLLETE